MDNEQQSSRAVAQSGPSFKHIILKGDRAECIRQQGVVVGGVGRREVSKRAPLSEHSRDDDDDDRRTSRTPES